MKNNQDVYLNYQNLMIEQEVSQEAVRRGFCERLDVSHQLLNVRRAILIKAMKDEIFRQIPNPQITELHVYYQDNLSRFTVPDTFKLSIFELDPSNNKLMSIASNMNNNNSIEIDKLVQTGAKQLIKDTDNNWFTEKQMNKSICYHRQLSPPFSTKT